MSNPELRAIYEADQAERQGELPPDLTARDKARLARVEALLAEGALRSAEDHLHAAFVFQHGDRLEHYWQAHTLALRAAELGHGPPARWLAAAAYDRWLMHQGRPQKYGTQFRSVGGPFELYPVDPETTDEERARWDVPSLAEAHVMAERLTREPPPGHGSPYATLGSVAVPGLRVLLVEVAPGEAIFQPDALPQPTPLDADGPHPLPTYLPAALAPRSFGAGYCAVDASGAFQATWIELGLPPDQPLWLPWDSADGPPPAMQGFELSGRPCVAVAAAWSAVSRERLPLVITRAGPEACWLVSGRLSIDQLARIAASLP